MSSTNCGIQSYDELRVTDIAAPVPKDREVLVDVKAAGLNFVDLLYVSLSLPTLQNDI